ncbi:RecQ family ATP-dependent DNA helicase [Niabella ginsengisoli]|uniref:ATP-dependent DNA helicase RecQ n=1 Tax=Niabella ginsengisoli TaxID=522298 RepID=A0ABS9SEE5_9BACT|nr:ATP-dependent DNA helicase RecQ [Niabella ginsengisoli]MCH5596729.1 RecQ family ATP-dependent DNA helicase [Niabella ginsengisoli]
MSTIAQQTLKEYFGFDNFRPTQQEIVEAALQGNDVLALMPTGGGKSLCYQVPALIKDGLCLVISPLIALMNDQVQNLRRKNITAFSIHTGMQRRDVISILETAAHSNCKFLYVSPERLETALFKEYLPGLGVNLIAVDEAHCISQWGYDFRPPYLRIAKLREELPGVPVIALTASATPLVQQDICEKLSAEGENKFRIFRQSFERPNLSYSVFKVESRINKIISVLKSVQGSAIVYCKTRKRSKEISELLNAKNIIADFYNAGLSIEERSKKQERWIQNQTRVMVCTNAFGMGIDKPDVRIVIHADVPDCLENYYQEAGRAGRDNKNAYAVLLYNDAELDDLKTLPDVRYPDITTIRNVYRNVVHYLQLPEGESPGDSYDFNLKDFIKKFGQNVQTTIYGLKALEQDGWLSFNEQVFSPATVRFTIYKEDLYEYEKNFADYEPLIKTLLRTYEGIYDYPVYISEAFLAHLLKYDIAVVKEQLRKLHVDRVVVYEPQKDEPQVMLTRTRIKTALLQIDNEQHNKRKLNFSERIDKIVEYIKEQITCRSKLIGNYFGDSKMTDCGICDNCLRKRKASLSQQSFDLISNLLKEHLQTPMTTEAIFSVLKGHHKDYILTVINYWIDENAIVIERDGTLVYKTK